MGLFCQFQTSDCGIQYILGFICTGSDVPSDTGLQWSLMEFIDVYGTNKWYLWFNLHMTKYY